jgi:hypothetical protein
LTRRLSRPDPARIETISGDRVVVAIT